MNILIKKAHIIDPNSVFHNQTTDILVENGKITSIQQSITSKNIKTFQADNLHISPGWFDMQVNFRDPGFEHKEDLDSGLRTAAKGGFTGVACMPSTNPVIDSKSGIDYIRNKTQKDVVDVFPVGALSHHMKGKDISGMYDMHLAGAVAFSDDKKSIENAGLLKRALLYTKGFDGLIIHFPDDPSISGKGEMNEGSVSTDLGMKGIPALSESIIVARDIAVLDYCESKLHLSPVSAKESVEMIKKAKVKKLRLTAGVAIANLILTDKSLEDFDTNYKLNPPLRTEADIKALIKGLKDGTIDVICSDHNPEDEESKKREFEHAAFGMSSIQTLFSLLCTYLRKELNLEEMITKIAIRPREILQLAIPVIEEGANANFTLFDPKKEWVLEKSDILSKSCNTPFIGKKLTGKALAIYNKNLWQEC